MPTINDYKKKALNDAGYSGDINTAEWEWLKAICDPYVGTIPDMWRYALNQAGFSGSLPVAQSAMLKDLGYNDFSISNKWYKYWRDTPLTGIGDILALGADLALWFDENQAYKSSGGGIVTPDSILTYTAPSPKMVYGSDGVLTYLPMNLVTYSEQFDNAAWTKSNTTVTANQEIAPDGTLTADLLTKTSASSGYVRQAPSTAIGQVHVWSVYAKVGTGTVVVMGSSQTSQYAEFNLTAVTATVTTGSSTALITSVGNGWYRCSMTITTPTTLTGYEISPKTNGETLYIWGAQREQVLARTTPSTYIPTTTAAVYSLPRDYNPTTLAALGVLVEEARTNLLTYSEQFDNAAWTRGNIAAFGSGSIANAITAPDGTTTADKIVEAATTATHNMAQNATIVTATVYTYSVHAKAAERSWVCLEGGGGAGGFSVWFNLSTGAVGTISGTTAGNVSIVALPNGWYRCIVTDTSTSTSGAYRYFICDADNNQSYAGDGTSGLYLWGAQLEAGAFATSYIPTVASQVTRAADNISILTSAFPYSATAGTVVAEYFDSGINAAVWRIDDGGDNEYFRAIRDTGSMVTAVVDGGSAVGLVYLTATAKGTLTKLASAWAVNSVNAAINGTLGTEDPSVNLPTVTTLRVGNNRNAQFHSSHIKRLAYYASRKTDAELQVLST